MATTFSKLSKYFKSNKNSTEDNDGSTLISFEQSQEIAHVSTKSEYERLKLQKQQSRYLQSQWGKARNTVSYANMMHEANRIPSCIEYDQMTNYHLIGRALEIYMEEASTLNDKGEILNIFSSSERIEKELKNLFNNVLNVHTNLPMWIMTMIKYGDGFLHLNLDDVDGIIGVKQLATVDVERVDGDYMARHLGLASKSDDVMFRWRGGQTIEFKSWQVAHFRLLTDQLKMPYGTSILEKSRKTYQNLILSEDAMLTHSLIRDKDRLIWKIDVGNIAINDIEPYIQGLTNKFKRKVKVDPKTGQQDLKFNMLGIDQDIFIPVRGSADTSSVTKLEGTATLDTTIVDYLSDQLVGQLGVPKPFLNFGETVGDGKNLAMMDVRFSKTVARIQQAILMELNKIAIIHLYIKGFDNELGNFELSMNNPSIQNDVLAVELLSQKIALYRDATDNGATGIAAMSTSNAKKQILKMSDKEILADIQQQRMDKAVSGELEQTTQIIKDTTLFTDMDAIYGDPNIDKTNISISDDDMGDDGGSMGGGSMGGLSGDDGLDLDMQDDGGGDGDEDGINLDDIPDDKLDENIYFDKLLNNILKG